jgi:hypothetical protein
MARLYIYAPGYMITLLGSSALRTTCTLSGNARTFSALWFWDAVTDAGTAGGLLLRLTSAGCRSGEVCAEEWHDRGGRRPGEERADCDGDELCAERPSTGRMTGEIVSRAVLLTLEVGTEPWTIALRIRGECVILKDSH